MRYYDCRSLFLSCLLGVTAGLGLLPLSPALVMVQASELGSQKPQEGVIKTCTGQRMDLAPQLTDADLKGLTRCGSEVMPQLIEALKAQDWKVKVIAAHTLGLYGKQAQSVIPELSSLMQDENADVRFAVAQALGDIGTEAVVPVLAKALQDKDENVRVSAADAFLKIGAVAKPAKPVLIAALWDGNWYVRSRVAATISKLGLEESDIPKLMEPWKDGTEPDTGAIVSIMIAIDPHVRQQVQDVPLLFLKALQNSDPRIRESAAIALEDIVNTRPSKVRLVETTSALIRTTKDKDSLVRLEAYRALKSVIHFLNGWYIDLDPNIKIDKSQLFTKIEPSLILGLQDPEPSVRVASINAIDGLNAIDYSSLLDIISISLKLLQDQNPSVRQRAVDFLGRFHSRYTYSKTSQITSSQITFLLDIVTPSLIKTLYDQDEEVRLAAGDVLDKQMTLSIMIEVLQGKISPVELRRTAIKIIDSRHGRNGVSREILVNGKYPFYLLKQALRDTDIGIRVNAAFAFERIQQIDSQIAANIFMEGLKSDNPSIRLTAILGLNQMCFSNAIIQRDGKFKPISGVEKKRCLDAKSAIKLLIASLNDEVKSIQYAAAFALTDIDPKEEYSIPILRKILLEEYNYLLREYAKNSLAKIGSQYAYSTLIQSLAIEDKIVRYSRSVERVDFIYPSDSVPSFPKDVSLLIDALEDENIHFLASNTLPEPYWKTINLEDLLRVENVFMKLTLIIKDKYTYNQDNLVLKNVFKLKNQDIRRSAVYSLGKYGERLVNSESKNNTSNYTKEDFLALIKIKKGIIETLTEIINDQSDDINVRWMAAVSLQDMNVDVSHFYAQNNFINPDKVHWQFSRSRKGRGKGPGLRFDIYSADIIYDNRAPGGAGLAEIYDTLRKLLNQGRK